MKDKGSVLPILMIFVLVSIIFAAFLGTMAAFQTTTTAGCWVDVNGTVHDCAQSDNNYWAIVQTYNNVGGSLSYLGQSTYLLVGAGLIITISMLFAATRS
jgi:hypothetical protein